MDALAQRHTFGYNKGGVVEYIQSCSPRTDKKEQTPADLEGQIANSDSVKPLMENSIAGPENQSQLVPSLSLRNVSVTQSKESHLGIKSP